MTVVGAGGKMGMRVSASLERSNLESSRQDGVPHTILYAETSPAAKDRVRAAGRELTDAAAAVPRSDVVILAVPDVLLGEISARIVPAAKPGAIVLTLDPAAAYAGVLTRRDDLHLAVAHPCHPSVFLERTSKEEWADTFGGQAAPQEVVAAIESGNATADASPEGDGTARDSTARDRAEAVIRAMYAPVLNVHWVTVEQLAFLEPTLVETITCMISGLLAEALKETVNTVGVPEAAAKAMLFGHTQVALTNSLRGSNPFSEACLIAMDYGRQSVITPDWKKVFDRAELDGVIARMLRIEKVIRADAAGT
ncbi:MAG TPA: phosphogluconate dehydrogenase C-terminal domain-containing protein [Streptosporangiaceae bacterium]|nr:phosphogluconate dehydrogenase C-terminal domain-containing protein [Streptosporangiaceae bacterium]